MAKICEECGYDVEDGVDMTYCPVCEGYLEEVGHCKRCGKTVAKVDLDEGFCPNCQDAIVDHVIKILRLWTTPKERKLFREFISEEDFDAIWED